MKNNKPLTTLEAANIGRKMGVHGLCIYRDDIDRSLWRVVTPGRNETHEPMDEKTWREFITASGWLDNPLPLPGSDEQDLFAGVREQLSPHAIASIVSHIQGSQTNNQDVDRQVRWFAEELCKLLGGYERQAKLAEELGL
jgi:hypothetical protein